MMLFERIKEKRLELQEMFSLEKPSRIHGYSNTMEIR
jgi:hypothetical protein